MLLVDTIQGKIIDDERIKGNVRKETAIRRMAGQQSGTFKGYQNSKRKNGRVHRGAALPACRKPSAIPTKQYRTSIRNMALNGAEGIGAMGVDTPLAVLSKQNQTTV